MPETRVYRLEIIYPYGSDAEGWEPQAWRDLPRRQRRKLGKFRWPRERLFLSSSGACQRASLLRWYGAEAEVYRSEPVTWPDADPPWELDAYQSGPAWYAGEADLLGLSADPQGRDLEDEPGSVPAIVRELLSEGKAGSC